MSDAQSGPRRGLRAALNLGAPATPPSPDAIDAMQRAVREVMDIRDTTISVENYSVRVRGMLTTSA